MGQDAAVRPGQLDLTIDRLGELGGLGELRLVGEVDLDAGDGIGPLGAGDIGQEAGHVPGQGPVRRTDAHRLAGGGGSGSSSS